MDNLDKYEREAGDTWPYDTFEDLSLFVQENTLVTSLGECLVCEVVIFLLLVGHSWVDHDNVVLIMIVQVVDDVPHPLQRETVRVQSHDVSVVHVVDCHKSATALRADHEIATYCQST
jgi:hypothetical protein